jgi:hypothetical protein
MGEKIDINDETLYKETLKYYQQRCQQIHGDNPKEWEEAKYLNRLEKQRLAVSKRQRLQRNRSSKKEQNLYNWITAENTYNSKYKKKQTIEKEFNEYEWLNSFPAQPYSASGGRGYTGKELSRRTDKQFPSITG